MSRVDHLRTGLEAALADLISALEGIAEEAFEQAHNGSSIRDLLWRLGLHEDWTRRAVDQGISGRPIDGFVERDRPSIAQTVEYLITWLEQCRRPTLALLRRLPEDALDREFTLATGESTTAAQLLDALARRLHADATQVRAWRGSTGG